MLCAGQDAGSVAASGFELVSAAIARRKAVIIIDLAGGAVGEGDAGWSAHPDDGAASQPGGELAALVEQACLRAGAPLRTFAGPRCRYDPLASLGPVQATGLVLAVIDWRGASAAQRQFCASYLNAALALIAASAGRRQARRPAVLDELTDLLQPGALRGSLRQLPGHWPGAEPLSRRVRELSGQLSNDPALISPVAAQLAALRTAEIGRHLGVPRPVDPVGAESPLSLRRALADREVVLFPLDRRLHGRPAVTIARLVVADLTAILAEHGGLAAQADCLVWISGCELIDPGQLTELVAAGAGAGTAVLLGTAAEHAAARLAGDVNVVVVRGPAAPGLARVLGPATDGWRARDPLAVMPGEPASGAASPAADLTGQWPDELSLFVRGPRPRMLTRCLAAR